MELDLCKVGSVDEGSPCDDDPAVLGVESWHPLSFGHGHSPSMFLNFNPHSAAFAKQGLGQPDTERD